MHLNNLEKELISREIENLESKSSAELVAVITKSSDDYKYEATLASLIITFLISLISIYFDIDKSKLFELQIVSFFGFYFLFYFFKNILFYLLPKNYKYKKASNNATIEFFKLGLHLTQTQEAIMFYVSTDEKFVKIITDKNIKEKIDDSYWQKIVDDFLKDVKNKEFSNGYIKAIKSCNKILIEKFPIKSNDKNELQNEVIEL